MGRRNTIDPAEFARWMGVVADRFNRDIKAETLRFYYQELTRAGMTTELYNAAMRVVLRSSKYQIPSVEEILEAAGMASTAAPALEAGLMFTRAREMTTYHPVSGTSLDLERIQRELGEEAYLAIMAAGGPRRFTGADERSLDFMRKAFVEAYETLAHRRDREEAFRQALPSRAGVVRTIAPSDQRLLASGATTTPSGDPDGE